MGHRAPYRIERGVTPWSDLQRPSSSNGIQGWDADRAWALVLSRTGA